MEQTQQNHFTALFYKNVLLGILSMAVQSIFILADHCKWDRHRGIGGA